MNREIEWFCYHTVQEGLLTAEECRAVAEAIEESDVDRDLATFAQTAVDNELCTNVERLEELMEHAQEAAASMQFPPKCFATGDQPEETDKAQSQDGNDVSVQGEDNVGQTTEAATAAAQQPEAEPEGRGETEAGTGKRLEELREWPDLAKATDMEYPEARELMNEVLAQARKAGCSDLHISAGAQPFVRYKTQVHRLDDQQVICSAAAERLNLSITTDAQRATFEQSGDMDICYATEEGERYRTNLHRQRLGVSGAYRIIDNEIPTLAELGFPRTDILEKLTTYHQGLILLTGPAGCGKSTTMNSFVQMINHARYEHIVSVEDPVEFIHQPQKCNVTQREVGNHTQDFSRALRASLREDPDIIVIGELRDLETIEMAIRASETGHLVLGTLHTLDAASTVDRILDVFPPEQQGQIRSMVSENLKGVICQELIFSESHDEVYLASEIMLGTLAIANIIREGDTFKLPSTIQTSYNAGMRTMEQSVYDLYMENKLSYEEAMNRIEAEDLVRKMQTNEAKRAAQSASKEGKKKRRFFK